MRELYLLRKFERRANTLYRNAEALFSDLVEHYGHDGMVGGDNVTDFADNVVGAADDLISILERAIRMHKEKNL